MSPLAANIPCNDKGTDYKTLASQTLATLMTEVRFSGLSYGCRGFTGVLDSVGGLGSSIAVKGSRD